MLKELIVKNIVLIESIKIEFKKGLSVLTGETGTGGTIWLIVGGTLSGSGTIRANGKNGGPFVSNTCGGGGASGNGEGTGGAGSDGVIILRVSSDYSPTFTGGVTYSTATVGSDKVYTITATSNSSQTVSFE